MCNYTVNLTDLSDCLDDDAGATILSPVLMSLTGVLGNILALYQLYTTRTDVRTTKFYSLITGLAWTDFLGILMTSPSVICAYVNHRQWVGGDAHCRFHGFTMVTFGLATPLIICAMAVERFLALKCVFFYSSRCRTGTARGCILVLWFGVILYGLLPLFGFGNFEKQYPGTWCFLDFHSKMDATMVYGYIYACTTLLLILIIFLCNAYVMVTIFKTRYKRERSESYNIPEHDGLMNARVTRRKSNDSEIQMIVLLCAITVVFTVCWAPLTLRIIITQATGVKNVLLDLAAVRMASLNQTLDPWLYILLRRSTCDKLSSGVRRIQRKCFRVMGIGHGDGMGVNNERINGQKDNRNGPPALFNYRKGGNEMLEFNRQHPNTPDVMNTVIGGIRTPMPDITQNTQKKNQDYVCQLQFGKSVLPEQEEGMYVKILYLPTKTPLNTTKTAEQPFDQIKVTRKIADCNIPLPLPQVRTTEHPYNPTFHKKGDSESATKETSLSKDTLKDFHSVTPVDKYKTDHESLRKTRSSNK